MRIKDIIGSTIRNRCPRCHSGKVFLNDNPYSFRNGLSMAVRCSKCELKYERETGFFYGAMYVTYAMVAGLFTLMFVADLLFFDLAPEVLFGLFSLIILSLFPLTYRWSRLVWINFFVKKDLSLLTGGGKQEAMTTRRPAETYRSKTTITP